MLSFANDHIIIKDYCISQQFTLNSVSGKLGFSRQKDFGIGQGMTNDEYTLYQKQSGNSTYAL